MHVHNLSLSTHTHTHTHTHVLTPNSCVYNSLCPLKSIFNHDSIYGQNFALNFYSSRWTFGYFCTFKVNVNMFINKLILCLILPWLYRKHKTKQKKNVQVTVLSPSLTLLFLLPTYSTIHLFFIPLPLFITSLLPSENKIIMRRHKFSLRRYSRIFCYLLYV